MKRCARSFDLFLNFENRKKRRHKLFLVSFRPAQQDWPMSHRFPRCSMCCPESPQSIDLKFGMPPLASMRCFRCDAIDCSIVWRHTPSYSIRKLCSCVSRKSPTRADNPLCRTTWSRLCKSVNRKLASSTMHQHPQSITITNIRFGHINQRCYHIRTALIVL